MSVFEFYQTQPDSDGDYLEFESNPETGSMTVTIESKSDPSDSIVYLSASAVEALSAFLNDMVGRE